MKLFPMPELVEGIVPGGSGIGRVLHDGHRDTRLTTLGLPGGERTLRLQKEALPEGPEAYRIEFQPDEVVAAAAEAEGIFRALTTLRQWEQLPLRGTVHDYPKVKLRVRHIDFKRLAWNPAAVIRELERLAQLKVNAVLLEYEDKFPFVSHMGIVDCDAFTAREIAEIERCARDNFIKIIPLQQSIGHLEYIFRHPEYQYLSEDPSILSNQLCPCKEGAVELFCELADELMAAHPGEYFHVGGDEPFLLGRCPQCAAWVREHGAGKLYIEHMNRIFDFLASCGRKVVFWADALLSHPDIIGECRAFAMPADWEYQAQTLRVENLKIHGKERMPVEKYREMPLCERGFFDGVSGYSEADGRFDALPWAAFLQERGLAVFGAGNVWYPDNILVHAREASARSFAGVIGTCWAAADSLRPPYAISETHLPGIAMLAAACWNPDYEAAHRDTFAERAAQALGMAPELFRFLESSEDLFAPDPDVVISEDAENAALRIPGSPGECLAGQLLRKRLLERELDTLRGRLHRDLLLPESAYATVDLKAWCNAFFGSRPEKPGWTHIPGNDIGSIGRGRQIFHGIPFDIRPDENHGSLVFAGPYANDPALPQRVTIPVGRRADALCLLHALAEGRPTPEGYCGYYRIHYRGGSEDIVPLVFQQNIASFWRISPLDECPVAWHCLHPNGVRKGLYLFPYFSLRPYEKIVAVTLEATPGSTLALAALTCVDMNAAARCPEIELLAGHFRKLSRQAAETFGAYLAGEGLGTALDVAFGKSLRELEILLNLAGRENTTSDMVEKLVNCQLAMS